MHILSVLLMRFSPKWLKYDKKNSHYNFEDYCFVDIYTKIIEYIIIPNIANSHFVF